MLKSFEKRSLISEISIADLIVSPQSKIMKNDGHEAACMLCIYCKKCYVGIYQNIGLYQYQPFSTYIKSVGIGLIG